MIIVEVVLVASVVVMVVDRAAVGMAIMDLVIMQTVLAVVKITVIFGNYKNQSSSLGPMKEDTWRQKLCPLQW